MTRREAIAGGAMIGIPGLAHAATPEPPTKPLLGQIRAVTTTAEDLGAVKTAYETVLGYRVVEHAVVSTAAAGSWAAPAVAGREILTMQPASGQPTYLRFVQQAQPSGFRPMTTFGWNATEIIVQDCDAVEARLKGTAFHMVSPPRALSSSAEIRAMQATGPANEMLYLTAVTTPLPASRDMPTAEAFIGRCFIAVVGGPNMPAMTKFYQDTFGNLSSASFTGKIGSLSIQNRLPPDTAYDLAVIQLGGGTKMELDAYPSVATVRPRPPGGLPSGMAMVSFNCASLDRFSADFLAPPLMSQEGPFKGHRVGLMAGAAGELIELVEA